MAPSRIDKPRSYRIGVIIEVSEKFGGFLIRHAICWRQIRWGHYLMRLRHLMGNFGFTAVFYKYWARITIDR
jgi:hypothetical protein